ncbi:MAG: DUF3073 domain-containing protein [Propioniciclava sp.]
MGRGRAKAKQTKVARDLKYRTVDTDFSSLERELRSGSTGWGSPVTQKDDDDYDDPYAPEDGDVDDDRTATGRSED